MLDHQAELAWGKQFEFAGAEALRQLLYPEATLIELPAFADVDFQIVGPGFGATPLVLQAFLEVKARRNPSTAFPTVIYSARKHYTAKFARRYLQVPTVCLYIFTDGCYTFELTDEPDRYEDIARDGRGAGSEHCHYSLARMQRRPELDSLFTLPTADGR